MALAPVVGDCVGKDAAVLVEAGLGDGLLALVAGLQFGPGVFVPEGVAAVTADSCESAVHGVEGDVVDSEDVLEPVDSSVTAVTLEGEVVLRVGGVDVLDGHPPLHAAQSEPCGGAFLVPEYGDTAVLVLQWRVNPLVLLGLPVQLVDDDAPAGGAHHGHGIVHVGTVGPLRQVDTEHWSGSPGVPELECFVPAAGHQGGVVLSLHPPAGLDRGLVLSHLDSLVTAQVPALDCLVTASHEHLHSPGHSGAIRGGTTLTLLPSSCQHTSSMGPPIVC